MHHVDDWLLSSICALNRASIFTKPYDHSWMQINSKIGQTSIHDAM